MKFDDFDAELQREDQLTVHSDEDFAFEVSHLITEARLKAGLTQSALAELIGTQQPSIARIEKGSQLPSLQFLKKIADAIGTHLIPPRFAFMEKSPMHVSYSMNVIIYPSPQVTPLVTARGRIANSAAITSPFQIDPITGQLV